MKQEVCTRHLLRKARARESVLDLLRRRYMREKQHAMRYRQHAARIEPEFRATLLSLAAEEERHAASIGAKIIELGETLPEVIAIHVAQEPNSWSYLRTDFEEERRCIGEVTDWPAVAAEFSDVAEMLERIEADSERHRAKLRDMLARSTPSPLGP